MNKNYNPHHGLERDFLTSWDHSEAFRYDIPQRILNAVHAIKYAAIALKKNTDRPVTSNVVPLFINPLFRNGMPKPTTDENGIENLESDYSQLLKCWKILEDWIYEYQPLQSGQPRSDGQTYKINKLFNTRDIDQWRSHLPALYVKSIGDDGRATETTYYKQEALSLYVKETANDRKSWKYTIEEGEAISIDGEGKKLAIRLYAGEDYAIFLEFKGRNGIEFGSHLSQTNYSKFGFIECWGDNKIVFKKGDHNRLRFLDEVIEFGQEYSLNVPEEGSTASKANDSEYVKARIIRIDQNNKQEYGAVRYIKLLTEDQMTEEQKVYTNSNGERFIKKIIGSKIFYERIYEADEIGL